MMVNGSVWPSQYNGLGYGLGEHWVEEAQFRGGEPYSSDPLNILKRAQVF